MRKLQDFTINWLPGIIWMMIIFYLSSRTRVTVADDSTLNFLFFKTLHVIEYAVLYFLLFRGFYHIENSRFSRFDKLILPMLLAVLYAISDEIHQTFVPTREGRLRDVGIDLIGIFFMYSYIKYRYNEKH